MEYLRYFETTSAHDTAYSDWGGEYKEPWVGYNAQTSSISYNDPEYVEIPSGYRLLFKGYIIASSPIHSNNNSSIVAEINQGTGLATNGEIATITGDYSNVWFKPSDSDTVYKLYGVFFRGDLEYCYVSEPISLGRHDGIYLRKL